MGISHYNLCLLGFGNVGRNFASLLQRKSDELRDRYGITWTITGVATRHLGWLANPGGLDIHALLEGQRTNAIPTTNVQDWLESARADVLFEISSLNVQTGQPAVAHIRAALEHGAHAITANKGTVVHAYHELRDLARAKGRRFLFEATVMDSTPIFSLFRETLPAATLLSFCGLLNSTTSVILSEIEAGHSLEAAITTAQAMGITETDPSADIDGWDAAVKVVSLATVLMDVPLKLADVHVEGIRGLDPAAIQTARAAGTPYKLVSRAERVQDHVVASVRPERVPLSDPLGSVSPEALLLTFRTDTLRNLTLIEQEAGPDTTAYGLLTDFIALRPGF